MELTDAIKSEIKNLYDTTPESVHGVMLGYKQKNGEETGEIGIVFKVDKKLPIFQIPQDQLLPSTITVEDQTIVTDVVESQRFSMQTCYSFTDPEVTRLQGGTAGLAALTPMRGGQEIIQYPTNFTGGYIVGTVGFYAVDNIDDRVVGVTNAHVLVDNAYQAFQRSITTENANPFNTYEAKLWLYNSTMQYPGCLIRSNNSYLTAGRIKRYQPISKTAPNYADVCIFHPDASRITTQSYKIWQPTSEPDYSSFMSFANSSDIANLFSLNPPVYSTGRSTGPKGYGATSSCQLRISAIGASVTVNMGGGISVDYDEIIMYKYRDNSAYPSYYGDSGSAVIGEWGGSKKIIGLLFAGSTYETAVCPITNVASAMNIRAWDGTYDTSTPVPYELTCPATSNTRIQNTITYGGKVYYQAGYTNLTYPVQVP